MSGLRLVLISLMCSLLLQVTALTFFSTQSSFLPAFTEMAAKASSPHVLNSTDLQISPDLFCDGEGPYKNKYSIGPTCEIFNAMELLEFLSWTWSFCVAADAQSKSTEWRSKTRTSTWYTFGPHCARGKKIVFSNGQSALHGSSAYAKRHGNKRARKFSFFLFRNL